MRSRSSAIDSRAGRARCLIVAIAAVGLWSFGGCSAYARFTRLLDRIKSWGPKSMRGTASPGVAPRKMRELADVLSTQTVVAEAEEDLDDELVAGVDANKRLLQSLLGPDMHLFGTEEFMINLRKRSPTKDPVTSQVMHDTWRVLDTTTLGLRSSHAQVAWYSGGHFLHDGSILNCGLIKGALSQEAPDARFTMPAVTISEEHMVARATLSGPDAHQLNISYTVGLKPMPPTFFQLAVQSLDLPGPMGHRTPLLMSNELLQVVYLDDQMLVWKDGFGNSEILVRESALGQLQ